VKIQQAFKFEVLPTIEQEQDMCHFAGSCRFVFNKTLALQKANHEAGKKYIRYEDVANLLPQWKREFEWLKDSPSQALQHSLKNLDRAFQNFFQKRADFPRFKKRGCHDSFRFPQGFNLDQSNDRIFLPKLGWVRYRNSRKVRGAIRNVTVSWSGGRWFISIQTAREVKQPVHPSNTASSVDMGIVSFGTMSDGTVLAPLNIFRRLEADLRKAQQAMSRKKKFSNNWKKAKAKVQHIHLRIANARRDFLHKASTIISKNHAMVALEALQVENMSRSAKGTVEKPGKNVRAKSGLNKSILDQGWSEFRRQLKYKLLWAGGLLVAVSPMNTSRTCLYCGKVSKDNRKTQAVFLCVKCGFTENADLVAAVNILSRGLRILRDEGQGTAHACAGRGTSVRIACEVNGEVMPSATGTSILRGSVGLMPALPPGIPFLTAQAAA
jgi:putative transposase